MRQENKIIRKMFQRGMMWTLSAQLLICSMQPETVLAAQPGDTVPETETIMEADPGQESSGTASSADADKLEKIYIRSAEDLVRLAQNCSYDAWSRDKEVILSNDISLGSTADFSILSFGGVFDGAGHKVTEYSVTGNMAPAGFFGVIESGAVVRNLTVEGTVQPGGEALKTGGIAGINRGTIENCVFYGSVRGEESTGGIAGSNEASGRIRNCDFQGSVTGRKETGGLAGSNAGILYFSSCNAYVNTSMTDPGISLEDLHLNMNVVSDFRRLMRMDTYNVATDTGGIAGFNEGSILGCISSGTAGCRHIGYNVGGIAGRSRGLISGAKNQGQVFGRRDIGGIVGMAEPYVASEMTEDSLEELRGELDSLNQMVDKASRDADSGAESLHAQMNTLNRQVNTASSQVNNLSHQLQGFTDGNIDELNRGTDLLNYSLEEMYDAVDSMMDATEYADDAGASVRAAADALAKDTGAAEAAAAMQTVAGDLSRVSAIRKDGTGRIRQGMADLRQAGITGYPDATVQEVLDGEEMLLHSLEQIHSALQGLENGMENGSISTLGQAVAYLQSTGLREALQNGPAALDLLEKGVDDMIAQTNVDNGAALNALQEIKSGIHVLRNGREGQDAGGIFYYMQDAEDHLELHFQNSGLPVIYFRQSIRDLDKSTDALHGSLSDLRRMLRNVTDEEQLQFAPTGNEMRQTSDALYTEMQQISDTITALGNDANARTGVISEDIREMNDQFRKVMDMVIDNIYDLEDTEPEDLITDTSEEDIGALTSGKLILCRNTGEVYADFNAGGIAGSMAVFNELDPESDNEDRISSLYHKQYELKSVLLNCTNQGPVSVRKSYAGGVCGYAQFGVISGCINDADIASENGDFAGGIAGYTDNIIRSCYAKGQMSGERYVGGIAGTPVLPDTPASNAVIENCTAIPDIREFGQYAGAIAGMDGGLILNNLFVSDQMGGLNGLSFVGRAEPAEYGDLLQGIKGVLLPQEIRNFHLSFEADGKILKQLDFAYGDSFDESVYPEIPAKEGYYGVWDLEELKNLRHDTAVHAVYRKNVTALAGSPLRSAQRPVFFAEGAFDDQAVLQTEPAVWPFSRPSTGVWQTLMSYNREILEQWKVEIPDDGKEQHWLRYLLPQRAPERCEIYLQDENGGWQRVTAEAAGSYLRFPVTGNTAGLTIVAARTSWWIWAVLGGIAAAIVLLVLRDIYVRKTAGKKQQQKKKKLPLSARLRRHAILILILILALSGSVAGFLHFAPGIRDGMGLYLLLHNYFERADIETELAVEAGLGEDAFRTDVSMYTATVGDRKVYCVDWQGIPIYYCDGKMILENGDVYRLNDTLPDYSRIFSQVLPLYSSVEISSSEMNGIRSYHAAAENEDAAKILKTLLPSVAGYIPETARVDVDLVTTDTDLSSVSFRWDKEQSESDSSPAYLRAVASFSSSNAEHRIPQMAEASIRNLDAAEVKEPGEDFVRLVTSFTELAVRDPVFADLKVQASCGPLLVNESLELAKTGRYGKDVFRIGRNQTVFYAGNGRISSAGGMSTSIGGGYMADPWGLCRIAYTAYMHGSAQHSESEGNHIYEIALDEASIRELEESIVPEAGNLALHFDTGSAVLVVDGETGKIRDLRFGCSGSTGGRLLTAPISLSAQFTFRENGTFSEVPEEVLKQLEIEQEEKDAAAAGTAGETGQSAAPNRANS